MPIKKGYIIYLSLFISIIININFILTDYLTDENIFCYKAPNGLYIVDYFNQTYTACEENEVFFGYCNPNTELIGYWKINSDIFKDGYGYYYVVVLDNIIIYSIPREIYDKRW